MVYCTTASVTRMSMSGIGPTRKTLPNSSGLSPTLSARRATSSDTVLSARNSAEYSLAPLGATYRVVLGATTARCRSLKSLMPLASPQMATRSSRDRRSRSLASKPRSSLAAAVPP